MNQKYHEFVGKVFPILVVSGLLALLIRLKIMDWKPDGFFLNMMFVLMFAFFITMHSHIVLLGEAIIELITRLFRKKDMQIAQIEENNKQIIEVDNQSNDVNRSILDRLDDNNHALEVENQITVVFPKNNALSIIDKSIKNNTIIQEQYLNEQINIAFEYIKKEFNEYASKEDIVKICQSVELYANKKEIPIDLSIKKIGLNKKDLSHFGWNIWNHFGGRDHLHQDEISKLLKIVFLIKFEKQSIATITSHLKDDENVGILKIKESLFSTEITKK